MTHSRPMSWLRIHLSNLSCPYLSPGRVGVTSRDQSPVQARTQKASGEALMQVTPEELGEAQGGSRQPGPGRGAEAASLPTAPLTLDGDGWNGRKGGKEGGTESAALTMTFRASRHQPGKAHPPVGRRPISFPPLLKIILIRAFSLH